MELGTSVPHTGPLAHPEFAVEYMRAAEAAGFDALWMVDHLVVPETMHSEYTLSPGRPRPTFEALRETMGLNLELNTTLAVAAAVTTRVKLCTGIAVLPIRNPLLNARQLASIDQYSGGRLLYGIGVGWLQEEAEALGMPWDRRGARSDEHIELLRRVWTGEGETVDFDGRFYRFAPIDPAPRPVQRPIPILVGGHSDVALDRVARLGDGWVAAGMGPDRFREAHGRLAAACERHDRDPADLQIVNGQRQDVTLDASLPDLRGQAEQVAEALRQYPPMGTTHMRVGVRAEDRAGTFAVLEAYGEHVIPSLRG